MDYLNSWLQRWLFFGVIPGFNAWPGIRGLGCQLLIGNQPKTRGQLPSAHDFCTVSDSSSLWDFSSKPKSPKSPKMRRSWRKNGSLAVPLMLGTTSGVESVGDVSKAEMHMKNTMNDVCIRSILKVL